MPLPASLYVVHILMKVKRVFVKPFAALQLLHALTLQDSKWLPKKCEPSYAFPRTFEVTTSEVSQKYNQHGTRKVPITSPI